MTRVPVSMMDKKKSYYKFYTRPMATPPMDTLNAISNAPNNPEDALRIHDRNRLFESGDLPGEFGWWTFEDDGTAMVANHIFMPNTTGEMFDWWFAWHPIDRLRYAIWDPKEHFDVYLEDKEKALDMEKSMRERHWGSVHYVWEDVGGGSSLVQISFKRPGEMGYDESKIDTNACSTIVCANCRLYGDADTPDTTIVMTHFLRPVRGGSELRSRFWFGWQIIDGEPVKCIPDGASIPAIVPQSILKHNVTEFTNLASILPEVYAEEKDNWEK